MNEEFMNELLRGTCPSDFFVADESSNNHVDGTQVNYATYDMHCCVMAVIFGFNNGETIVHDYKVVSSQARANSWWTNYKENS